MVKLQKEQYQEPEQQKELSIDEHNKSLSLQIKECEEKLKKLNSLYKSEAEKPQATLAQCNIMSRKK